MDKETLLSCRDVSLGYEGHTVWEHLTFSDRKSTRLNSSHASKSRMPSSA